MNTNPKRATRNLTSFHGCRAISLLLGILFFPATAQAESELSFAKSTQNPLAINPEARYFSLPLINYFNFGYGRSKQTQDIFDLKPVLPFPLTTSYDLIIRTIIPAMHQPGANRYINGIGDINTTAFLAPAGNSSLIWGIGPTFILPTATNTTLGSGKLSIGPELVLIYMPDAWTTALLVYNVWSVAGQPNRPKVDAFNFQYFITYNFPQGWYVTMQPTITANWQAASGKKWVVPFGGGAGRAFHLGKQAVNVSLQSYYNAMRTSTSPHWTLQLDFEFLFVDNRTTK
jgi:hypothetical protein